ncbi:MAG TPA: hypothetical protein VHM30_05455, partial [Gemmatimonadaceae bacterium]|nr:hypothetical protein [Gemmatimonadaceae bacterium]
AIVTQLPPALDGALAQRAAFAAAGTVSEGASARKVPPTDGADSALAADPGGRFALRDGGFAVAFPVLRSDDHVEGAVVARGGRSPGTRWIVDSAGPHWTGALDRLRSADSAAGSVRDGRVARGRVQAVPTTRGVVLTQATYIIRSQNPPALSSVALLRADSLRSGSTLLAALGGTVPAPPPMQTPADLRAAAAALYDSLRADQRRGDWRGFADHWDSLGRLLGRPPR